ncbi:MAG: enoyl-CoA hydratase [Polyangiaceae bacterium UTPRO1]|nr:enoyl-CoA hydratase-related protein [Myxococcales bacterium]OQY65958.1 MAG: enoyl-CoA hydratase [Polyangiaceae bacterium UTPRO1]
MSEPNVTREQRDGVAILTLNRPSAANSIDLPLARELMLAAIACDDDPEVRAVVLTGAGKMFCAGGDLRSFSGAGAAVASHLKELTSYLHAAISRLVRMDAPVIAAVNGMAAGAGFSLAAAADLVIAADTAGFVMAYTQAGLVPDGSSTFFLPRRIGDRRARELMLTNRRLSAAEALEWGLVNRVVPAERLLPEATALATTLAAGPTRALGAVKALLNESFEHGLEAQMELEARAIAAAAGTSDGREGVRAFLEKRKPEFTGR